MSVRRFGAALAILAALYWGAGYLVAGDTRLVRTTVSRANDGRELDVRRVHGVDRAGLGALLQTPGGIAVTWHGVWEVPAAGLYDVGLAADGQAAWRIDGHLALTAPGNQNVSRTLLLGAGFHDIQIRYEPTDASRLVVTAARTGTAATALGDLALKPRLPRHPWLRRAGAALHTGLGWLLIAGVAIAVRRAIGRWRVSRQRRHGDERGAASLDDRPAAHPSRRRWTRALAWAALVAIMGYGAWLRLDAITARYGPVTQPAWLASVQTHALAAARWRPARFVWGPEPTFPHQDGVSTRYRSDPYTYLEYAREMRTFYWAHYREPVFPFVTRFALHLLANQDVAVSFASASCSVLAILATYLLGAAVRSRLVGLLAAFAFAVDYDVVSLASEGWRDDAYVAAVALTAWMLLRLWRAASEPEPRLRVGRLQIDRAYVAATLFGVVAGLTILVRIMAASFVFPALVVLPLAMRRPWSVRTRVASVALVATIATAGPYFVNCWRVYGDPLYSFNVHGHIYRAAEGMADSSSSGTASYVVAKFRSHPFDMADTLLRGLTIYPFANKWSGMERWHASLGGWMALAALAGLPVLAASAAGRWLLFVLLTSVIPFAFTWKVDPSLRFTAFTYPLYLIAGASAVVTAGQGLRWILVPGRGSWKLSDWRSAAIAWLCLGTAALATSWTVTRFLPPRIAAHMLRRGEDVSVGMNAEDTGRPFIGAGWSGMTGSSNVRLRVTTTSGDLRFRLPRAGDYPATIRLDPFPRPLDDTAGDLPDVALVLNGATIDTLHVQWTPRRVGAYDVVLPRSATRAGANVLTMRVQPSPAATAPGLTGGGAVALWYVRLHPPSD